MKIAILFGPLCLSFRGSFDFTNLYDDPRGMTGSEIGFVRIAEELQAAGHQISLHTVAAQTDYQGMPVKPLDAPIEADVVIAVNEPDLLRAAPAGAKRICLAWLNDVSFCKVGFEEHVDLFLSPSAAHRDQMMKRADWHMVEKTPEAPNGKAMYEPDPAKWVALELGCDLKCWGCEPNDPIEWASDDAGSGLYCPNGPRCEEQGPPQFPKITSRVIYASSPDRGLHHLLAEWPTIRRAVPEATLHVFYRLEPWLRGFDQTPYFPPIEPLRARANYVEECLARFRDAGGMGVTLRDSVSRRTIEREMAQAEVLAYPCHTTTWSEGFSCTTLEACAAKACPIITDCDALGEVYAALQPVAMSPGWQARWRDRVIEAMKDQAVRATQNEKAATLAAERTWKIYVEKLVKEIESRWPQQSKIQQPPSSNPSVPDAGSS